MNSTDPTTPADIRYEGFHNPDQLAVLLDALGGTPISDSERRTLYWLSGWERDTVANIAALLIRARQAGPCQDGTSHLDAGRGAR